jgi:hypothetical protein
VAGISQGQNNQGHASCFLLGTTILTADGGRRVEDLAVGDLLPTMFGGLRPIQWIARYPFRKSDPSKPWVDVCGLFGSLARLSRPIFRAPIFL